MGSDSDRSGTTSSRSTWCSIPHNRRRQHRLTDQLIGKADQAHGGEIPGCTGVADDRIDCGDYEERHTEKEELGVVRSRRATGDLFFFPIVGRSLQAGQARLLAHGASFKSVPGRRLTAPGRALTRAHHAALLTVEHVVNQHYLAWQRGSTTPLIPGLDTMYTRWLALRPGERLTLEWPVAPLPATPTAHRSRRRRTHTPTRVRAGSAA